MTEPHGLARHAKVVTELPPRESFLPRGADERALHRIEIAPQRSDRSQASAPRRPPGRTEDRLDNAWIDHANIVCDRAARNNRPHEPGHLGSRPFPKRASRV